MVDKRKVFFCIITEFARKRFKQHHAVEQIESLWSHARYPLSTGRTVINCWRSFSLNRKNSKRRNRQAPNKLSDEDCFLNKVEQRFDAVHAHAMDLIENDEYKLFLKNQRKLEPPGCMVRLDNIFLQKYVKQASNKHLLESIRRLQLEKSSLLESKVLESRTDRADSDQSEEQPCTSSSIPILSKWEHQTVMSPPLAVALDRTKVSERAAATILF